MPRPQFTLKTMLWIAFSVAMFLSGMAAQRELDRPVIRGPVGEKEFMQLRDGTFWYRPFGD